MPIRIIIADDSPFVLDGLKIIFELDPDFAVIGCAKNGREAVELCKSNDVDIVLMDIQMPEMDGITATKEITRATTAKCLILTTFDDDELIIGALKNGAKGYLLKNHTPDKIKRMAKVVHEGGSILDEVVLSKITEIKKSTAQFDNSLFTERELDIIKLISEGMSNNEIAESLFISVGTVKNYITAILDKTGLAHRTQIAVYYLTGNKRGHSNAD